MTYIPAHIRGAIARDLAHLQTTDGTPITEAFNMKETNVYRVTITDPDISDAHQNEIGEWYITDGSGLADALDRGRFGVVPAYVEGAK